MKAFAISDAECWMFIQACLFTGLQKNFTITFTEFLGKNLCTRGVTSCVSLIHVKVGGSMKVKWKQKKTMERWMSYTRWRSVVFVEKHANRAHLRVHMVVHSYDRAFPCDVCSKRFKRAYELKMHKKIQSGDVNFSCGICGYVTFAKFKLMLHRKQHFSHCNFLCDVSSKHTAVSLSLKSTKQFMLALNPSSVWCVVMGTLIKTT